MLKEFFGKKRHYATLGVARDSTQSVQNSEAPKDNIPKGIVDKCNQCGAILIARELQKNDFTCPHCSYHFPIGAYERLMLTLDESSFEEIAESVQSADPIGYPDYPTKLSKAQMSTGLPEGTIVGRGTVMGEPVIVGVMDFRFMGASLGSAAGEKIVQGIEVAAKEGIPFVMFCAGGGMRMQEGILSLMQMAKTSAALAKLHDAGVLYISVITHPTTGGTSASFASLGDVILAEPGAMFGFTGRRVIEQTIRQKLPDDAQTAEFNKEHGMVDEVVHRKEIRNTLASLLRIHRVKGWSYGR